MVPVRRVVIVMVVTVMIGVAVSVKGEVSVHLADDRVIFGAEVEL